MGTFQNQNAEAILWGSDIILWGNQDVTWDDPVSQSEFANIVIGNQQGFVHYYNDRIMMNDPNLTITNVTSSANILQMEIINHNLTDGELIYVTALSFVDTATGRIPQATDLNNNIYSIGFIDSNNIRLFKWNTSSLPHQYVTDFSYTPDLSTSTYVGCGTAALLPVMKIQSKDFNPYLKSGGQLKMSYIDFLTDVEAAGIVSISVFVNTSLASQSNILTGNKHINTDQQEPYYIPKADYSWHRFYQTCAGQFVRVQVSYDNDLLNTVDTHLSEYILNAMTLWVRPGGKVIF